MKAKKVRLGLRFERTQRVEGKTCNVFCVTKSTRNNAHMKRKEARRGKQAQGRKCGPPMAGASGVVTSHAAAVDHIDMSVSQGGVGFSERWFAQAVIEPP